MSVLKTCEQCKEIGHGGRRCKRCILINGTVKERLQSAWKRHKKMGFNPTAFDLYKKEYRDSLSERIYKGICEVTGIRFEYEKNGAANKNPLAPSFDRIDLTKGYEFSNVRVTTHWFNNQRSNFNDDISEKCVIQYAKILNKEKRWKMNSQHLKNNSLSSK